MLITESSVQLLSCVQHFAAPWTAARKASLSITNAQNLLKLMSIELVMPSNHLILCHPLLLPSFPAGSFQMSQFFASDGQSIGVSASASVLPMNIQHWIPLGLTGLSSLQSLQVLARDSSRVCVGISKYLLCLCCPLVEKWKNAVLAKDSPVCVGISKYLLCLCCPLVEK